MGTPPEAWMAEALRAARRGLYSTQPNPRVGCVIVKDDRRVATGWHEYTGGPHAEVNAIAATEIPHGADFYVTMEPCSHHGRTPPCVDAVLACRPARVIVAMTDPNPLVAGRGLEQLRAAGVAVESGVLETEARALNPGFVKRMLHGLPHLSVKMASSLDGKTALRNGASRWITGAPARRDVQFLRARASAILSSASTVLADDPSLDVRLDAQELGQERSVRQPPRVIVDSRLRLDGTQKLFATGGEVWVYTTSTDSAARSRLEERGARVIAIEADEDGRVCLPAMLRDLANREISEIHCECGAGLAGALVAAGLADELILYLAPHLLGDAARGSFDLGELTAMQQRIETRLREQRQVGDDLRLTLALEN